MTRKVAVTFLALLIAAMMPVCTGSKHLNGAKQKLGKAAYGHGPSTTCLANWSGWRDHDSRSTHWPAVYL